MAALKKLALWTLGILAAIGLLGFLVVPPLAKSVAQSQIAAALGRGVQIGSVSVNPYALSATVRGFRVYEPDGRTPFASFEELHVNVSALSLLRLAPVISELRIDRPSVTIVRRDDREFNFSDIVAKLARRPRGDSRARYSVAELRVDGGRIEFDDRPLEARHVVSGLSLRVPWLSSLPAQRDAVVEAELHAEVNGTAVALRARTRPFADTLESSVTLAFRDLDLARYLRYVPVAPAIAVPSARLDSELRIVYGRTPDGPRLLVSGTLGLRELVVLDGAGTRVAKLAHLAVPVEEVDVYGRRAAFGAVLAQALELDLVRMPDGRINLAALLPRLERPPVPAGDRSGAAGASVPAFGFRIAQLQLAQASVSFSDQTLARPFRTTVAPLEATVHDLSNAAGSEARIELALATGFGERLAYRGVLSLEPPMAAGSVEVAQLRPRHYAPYLVAATGIDLTDGVLDLAANFRLARPGERFELALADIGATLLDLRGRADGEPTDRFRLGRLVIEGGSFDAAGQRYAVAGLRIDDAYVAHPHAAQPARHGEFLRLGALAARALEGTLAGQSHRAAEIAVRDATATPPGGQEPPVRAGTLTVRDAGIDLAERMARAGEVAAADGGMRVTRSRDGRISLLDFVPAAARAPAAPAAPVAAPIATPARPPAAGSWNWAVDRVALERFDVQWDDAVPDEPVSILLSSIALATDPISSARGTRSAFRAQLTVNRTGSVAASGRFGIDPPAAEANLSVTALGLLPLQPYFTEHLNLLVTSGMVTARGKASFDAAARPPRAAFAGEATVAHFAALDKNTGEDLLRWRSLHAGGIDTTTEPLSVAIGEIALSELYARTIITRDGRFNLHDIVVRRDAGGNVIGPGPSGPLPPAEAARREAATPAARDRGAVPAQPEPAPARARERPPITIGRVSLTEGNINFSDFFIKPNYTVNLTDMTGTVSALSSVPGTAADLELRGRLDGAAPVEIVGRLNPLAADAFLDIKGTVKGAEMTTLSPYSQKFLGYGIERGRLSLAASYRLEQRRLEGQNRVFLDQLTFGEPVESPTATRLPVLFAVALLQNRAGEIDINLPISGTLDDPEFSLGAIIVRVIINLIARAVTAPFALLGALLPGGGGGEELSFAGFEPGRHELTESARKRLEGLAHALSERPALRLDITGGVDPDADRRGLQRVWLERQVRAARARERAREGVVSDAAHPPEIDPREYERYLRIVYREANIARPRDALGMLRELPVSEMETLLLTSHAVGDDDLRRLAVSRAQAVEEHLVDHGVSTERIFQVPSKTLALPARDQAPAARVDLSIRN
jgi:hypothetical protein